VRQRGQAAFASWGTRVTVTEPFPAGPEKPGGSALGGSGEEMPAGGAVGVGSVFAAATFLLLNSPVSGGAIHG